MNAMHLPERQSLIERLPAVRGSYETDANLAPVTWFRVGGPAEVLYSPADTEDLAAFMAGCPADVPLTFIGVASNTLIRDGGIPGVTIKLGRPFGTLSVEGEIVYAGAAAPDRRVAATARDHGLAGLEFLTGVPGLIGGALRMNAGAYGREMVDITEWAEVVTRAGEIKRLTLAELGLTYRHSDVAEDWIFTRAALKGTPGDAAAITARMEEISTAREDSQPVKARTGGSTFANPPGHKAWQLVDAVGGRGLKLGGAMVSEKHTNFLINTGDATAADIEALGEEVRRRVHEKFGIELRWEIRRVGVALPAGTTQDKGDVR
jgi:UDP-N-acetylmuramate dehydrogenase